MTKTAHRWFIDEIEGFLRGGDIVQATQIAQCFAVAQYLGRLGWNSTKDLHDFVTDILQEAQKDVKLKNEQLIKKIKKSNKKQ